MWFEKHGVSRFAATLLLGLLLAAGAAFAHDDEEFLELTIEDLLNVEVTSASKRAQPLQDAAAAIFVITNDDLSRWGVTNIPDALRYVPGLQVASVDANKWAISSRGHNGRFSNKLLVLIDGRSVYTPMFSGVYWEIQDVLLADVDRIEIIRGPGSTLWGANAVNGVINIITRHAADTQGGLAAAGAGDFEKGFGSLRYGARWGEDTFVRASVRGFERGAFDGPLGGTQDEWNLYRGSARLDKQIGAAGSVSLQGAWYDGDFGQIASYPLLAEPWVWVGPETGDYSGAHVMADWKHTFSPTSDLSVRAYWDHARRSEIVFAQDDHQFDLDVQHSFAWNRHLMIWGAGYRHQESDLETLDIFTQIDDGRSDLYSVFAQDQIELRHDVLSLTLGSKFEHHEDTGWEVQPTARLAWRPHEQHRAWAAVTRAVRTPMGVENRLESLYTVVPPGTPDNPSPLPLAIIAAGNLDFESENLTAYEAGYRFTRERIAVDLATFYHAYSDLETLAPGEVETRMADGTPYLALPTTFVNGPELGNYGLEASVLWESAEWRRWTLNYSLLLNDEKSYAGAAFLLEAPRHQVSGILDLQLPRRVDLSLMTRYVGDCKARYGGNPEGAPIDGYLDVDVAVRWRIDDAWQLSVAGRNLLEEHRQEYLPEIWTLPAETVRSVYAQVQWKF